MIIDNFSNFEDNILNFDTDNTGDPYVYQIDIIARKKDGVKTSGANNSARKIASFYPENIEQWNKFKTRIMDICDSMPGVRAYINPSRKRASKILKQLNVEISDRIFHSAYTGQYRIYSSSVAKTKPYKSDALWIIDIDCNDPWSSVENVNLIKDTLCRIYHAVIVATIPSRLGVHIITKPFDKRVFKAWLEAKFDYVKEDIIKDNALTNLYINTGEN